MKYNASIQIEDEGRSGTIHFKNDYTDFNLWWEFAGSDAIAIIEAPASGQWELRTKRPLSQREEVLTCIGQQVVAKKVSSNGYFTIDENCITIYSGNG